MRALMEDGEPELIVGLVTAADLHQGPVGGEPPRAPVSPRTLDLRYEDKGDAGRPACLAQLGCKLRRCEPGHGPQVAERVSQLGLVEAFRPDIVRGQLA